MARLSPQELDRIARDDVPLVGALGIRFLGAEDGRVTARLPYGDNLLRPGGTISGPALMAVADLVMYACVLSVIGPVKLAVTTSLNANFLRKPPAADILAEGRLLKCGKRLAYGEVTLFSEGDPEPVCHVTATYSIPPPDLR